MVKHTRTNIARDLEKSLPSQSAARQSSRKEKYPTDDVIMSLANAHENRRARQVVEWQHAQPANVRQAI